MARVISPGDAMATDSFQTAEHTQLLSSPANRITITCLPLLETENGSVTCFA
jgi:hypothetical protein